MIAYFFRRCKQKFFRATKKAPAGGRKRAEEREKGRLSAAAQWRDSAQQRLPYRRAEQRPRCRAPFDRSEGHCNRRGWPSALRQRGNAHLRTVAPLPHHAALAGRNLWQGAGPAGARRLSLRARNFGTGPARNVRRPAHAAIEADGLPL